MKLNEGGGKNLNSKTAGQVLGVVLVIIAIILGIVQHFVYNLYGSTDYKWYFWGLVAIIGLIGIVLAVWAYMKKK
jgi:hypothetical protein